MKVAVASVVLLTTCAVFGNPISPLEKKRDLDDSLVLRKKAASPQCEYDGKMYKKGTLLNITSKGECYLRKCSRRKFRKVPGKQIIQYCDEPCPLGWHPGCCLCKRKSCENNRKPGDTWMQVKRFPTKRKEGICSRCRCGDDYNEYCQDDKLLCFKPPGCQETEAKPMPDSCCPKCKIWKKTATTAQPTILITLTTVETEPYPFIFPPGFDSNEDEGR